MHFLESNRGRKLRCFFLSRSSLRGLTPAVSFFPEFHPSSHLYALRMWWVYVKEEIPRSPSRPRQRKYVYPAINPGYECATLTTSGSSNVLSSIAFFSNLARYIDCLAVCWHPCKLLHVVILCIPTHLQQLILWHLWYVLSFFRLFTGSRIHSVLSFVLKIM